MTRYLLRPRAQQDIQDVWDYSVQTWSADQAELYIRQIQGTLQLLAQDPYLGRAINDVRAGYRKHPAGSHVVFYRVLDDGIDVVRILHQRMDVEQHL